MDLKFKFPSSNPFINLYRLITPSARSVDEHPLLIKDIELIDKYFRSFKVTYFNLFTLLSVPFRKFKFFQGMYHILSILDDKLIEALPFMKKYYWMICALSLGVLINIVSIYFNDYFLAQNHAIKLN